MAEIIIRYGELWLKSEYVRGQYARILKDNIKAMLKQEGVRFVFDRRRDSIVLKTTNSKRAVEVLGRAFGISNYYQARKVKPRMEALGKAVTSLGADIPRDKTFAIRVRRQDKNFPLSSQEMEKGLGKLIKRKVDLTNPDVTINIDLNRQDAFIYSGKIHGLGGMPFGTSGRLLSLLSGGIDSPVASWLMMKRGCPLSFVYFWSYPFVGKKQKENVVKIAKILSSYAPRKLSLYVIPFGGVQEQIVNHCDLKYGCIIYRRAMHRAAELLAGEIGAKALVSGDNLAQVASQTLDNIITEDAVLNVPMFRPLIGMDKTDIIELSKRIGAYDASLGGELCFTSLRKNPATRSSDHGISAEEARAKRLQKAIERALKEKERILV